MRLERLRARKLALTREQTEWLDGLWRVFSGAWRPAWRRFGKQFPKKR
jgi:hypothetical protein